MNYGDTDLANTEPVAPTGITELSSCDSLVTFCQPVST